MLIVEPIEWSGSRPLSFQGKNTRPLVFEDDPLRRIHGDGAGGPSCGDSLDVSMCASMGRAERDGRRSENRVLAL